MTPSATRADHHAADAARGQLEPVLVGLRRKQAGVDERKDVLRGRVVRSTAGTGRPSGPKSAPGSAEHSVPGRNHSVTHARSPRCVQAVSSSGAKVVSAAVTASTRGSVIRCSAMRENAWSSDVACQGSRSASVDAAAVTGASGDTTWSADGGHRSDLLPGRECDASRRRQDPPALVDCDRRGQREVVPPRPAREIAEQAESQGATRARVGPGAEREPGARADVLAAPPLGAEVGRGGRVVGNELGVASEQERAHQHDGTGR